MKLFTPGIIALSSFLAVSAHLNLISPFPRGSGQDPANNYTNIDYTINQSNDMTLPPFSPTGRAYPCQGKPAGPVKAILNSGQKFSIVVGGQAKHEGGHLQVGLSYDSVDWISIYDVIRDAHRKGSGPWTFTFTIPSKAPSADAAVLSWNWINASGNREFYTNCVDVKVNGVKGGVISGPRVLVVNFPGTPRVPEMTIVPASEDGRALFPLRPIITICPGVTTKLLFLINLPV